MKFLTEQFGIGLVYFFAGSGICGVAVISAIYAKEDIAAAARELRLAVEGMVAE